ncbi:hypothetical protein HYY74_02925 [Candidatus Woesearchaeota archaeon]|nr:hypothetical protein [Candidatus Woesearchaeota archaeon]
MPSHLPADLAGSTEVLGGMLALFAAFLLLILVVFIVLYIYIALALMTIAKKTNTANAWLAWVPIGNIYLMTQIAKVHWAWLFVPLASFVLQFLPLLGLLGLVALLAWPCWLWWKICEARNKPAWWGIIIGLIPLVNLVMIGIVAWSD